MLLLNTCLTVEEGQAASHSKKGWEVLTDSIIQHVAQQGRPTVFMLWGSHAQSKRVLIPQDRGHLVLMSNHPRRCPPCARRCRLWAMATSGRPRRFGSGTGIESKKRPKALGVEACSAITT